MHLVEDDRRDAVEQVVEEHPGEDTVGDHLDPGAVADPGLAAHPVAHRAADGLAAQVGHADRRRPRRHPSGLDDDDAAHRPGLVEHARGTTVVLPAPGSACSTADHRSRRTARSR